MNPEDLAGVPPARLPFPVTRAMSEPVRLDGDKPMLRGRFTTFDDAYEVNSHIEGRFLETMAPGAFDRTVVESRKNIKVLFNHGGDPTMGDQILGDIETLRGDANYEVDPFPGIPPLIQAGLERGAYGSSHRFSVIADEWNHHPGKSPSNPDGIPERRITEARLYEFGPVTFPANPNATAAIRSTSDEYYKRTSDPNAYESLLRSAQVARTEGSPQTDAGLPPSPEPDAQPVAEEPPEAAPSDEPTEPRSTPVSEPLTTIEEKRARHDELDAAMQARSGAYPGVLPEEEQIAYNADREERNLLARDIAAWEERQRDFEARAKKDRKSVV